MVHGGADDLSLHEHETSSAVIPDEKGRITVTCRCNRRLKVPGFRGGTTMKCPACGSAIAVPSITAPRMDATATSANDEDKLLLAIRRELEGQPKERGSGARNLAGLAVSLLFFITLGLLRLSLAGILLLVLVLLVHEGGHYVAMKALKYHDVKMFFIPLFGAAVTGLEKTPSSARQTLVALLGPLPGILIGIGTGFGYIATGIPILADATRTFLFLNLFNLLPVYPFDGGRVLDAVLFSRHPVVEIVSKTITACLLGWVAYAFRDYLFGFLAVLMFLSLRSTYITATIAHGMKRSECCSDDDNLPNLSPQLMAEIVSRLKDRVAAEQRKPKVMAAFVAGIRQRLQNRPCKVAASAALLIAYASSLLIGFIALGGFEIAIADREERDSDRVEQAPAGDAQEATPEE